MTTKKTTNKRQKRKTQEQRKKDARDAIIKASFFCLGKYGYQNTSLSKIAIHAGCSKELPRYHFSSKDKLVDYLLVSTARDWGRIFEAPLKQNVFGPESLRLTLEFFGDKFAKNAEELRGQLALILAASDPFNRDLTKRFKSFQISLRKSVTQALTEGEFAQKYSAADIQVLVQIFLGATRGIAFQWMVDPSSINVKECFLRLTSMLEQDFSAHGK